MKMKQIIAAALLLLLLCAAAALLARKVLLPQKPPNGVTSFLAAAEGGSVNLSEALNSTDKAVTDLSMSGASVYFEQLRWYAPLLQNLYGRSTNDPPFQQTIEQNYDAFHTIVTGYQAGDPLTEEGRQTLSRLQTALDALLAALKQEDNQPDPSAYKDAYVLEVLSDYTKAAA